MESCVFVCEDFPKENQMHANKATHIGLGKTSNFLYILLAHVCFFSYIFSFMRKNIAWLIFIFQVKVAFAIFSEAFFFFYTGLDMPYRKSVARNTCALIGKSPIFRIAVKSVEYYLKNYFKPLFGIFLILLRCAKMCANVFVYD